MAGEIELQIVNNPCGEQQNQSVTLICSKRRNHQCFVAFLIVLVLRCYKHTKYLLTIRGANHFSGK